MKTKDIILKGNVFPKLVFKYYTQLNEFNLSYDIHESLEIMGVISGVCKIPLEDKVINLKAGECIFLNAYTRHGLIIKQPCKIFCVQILFDAQNGYIDARTVMDSEKNLHEFFNDNRDYFYFNDSQSIRQLVRSLISTYEKQGGYFLESALYQLLIKIAQNYSPEITNCEKIQNKSFKVLKTLEYISENYEFDIRLEEIASNVGLNESYLCTLFKKEIGLSIFEYVNKIRIEKAKELLEETDLTITEICLMIGLTSRQYFSKLFKQCIGISPKEYKTKYKRQGNQLL